MNAFGAWIGSLVARVTVTRAWSIAKVAVPALAIVGLAIAVMLLRSQRDDAEHQRDALRTWQTSVVVAVTAETVPADAQGRRPNVDPATVVTRIHGLGEDVRNLRSEIGRQNDAIRAAEAEGQARLTTAQDGAAAARQAEAPRQAARRAIEQPGRTTGLTEAEWSQL